MRHQFFILIFFIFLSAQVNAQLCQGSLGDPVVDINFGSGTNPGTPLPTSTTNYSYVNFDCPNDGQYAIRNTTQSCFGSSWYTLNSDHTGNANGYFMLVNASFQPSDFYVDTVHGLCPNTTFEFAAWILNILQPSACGGNGIKPNITFKIETTSGVLIDSFNTGNIPAASGSQWNQYGFYFTTAQNQSDVVIRMTNNAPGGCGNDLALDDITFRPCGPTLNTSILNNTQSDTINVCAGGIYSYTFSCSVSSGYPNPSYQWQENTGSGWIDIPGANSTSLSETLSQQGSYNFRMAVAASGNIENSSCRIVSNADEININSNPLVNIEETGLQCLGNSVVLTASGGTIYSWTGPDNFSSSNSSFTLPPFSQNDAGKYVVVATNSSGCSAKDSFDLIADPSPVAALRSDTNICSGSNVFLNGSGGVKYSWTPSSGLSSNTVANPVATPIDSTKYTLTVTNAFGCTDFASVNINVFQSPVISVDGNKIIIEGQSVQLNAVLQGTDISYYWSPDVFLNDINSLHPIVNPPTDTTYTLKVTSGLGCGSATASVFIKVYQQLTIPNAFSPNGDGINDTWKITPIDTYPNAEISVFNRYGQTVFHTTNFTSWNGMLNGKSLPDGTYYYLINLHVNLPKISGWLQIIR